MTRLSDRTIRGLAYAVFGVCCALIAGAVASAFANPPSDVAENWGSDAAWVGMAFGLTTFAFPAVGLLITRRDSRNVVGWLMLGIGAVWCWTLFADGYVLAAVPADNGSLPFAAFVNATTAWTWVPALGGMGVYLLLLFPDGRLPSRRWRPLAWGAGVVMVLGTLAIALAPGPVDGTVPGLDNPLGVEALAPFMEAMQAAALLLPICIVASAVGLVVRFRRSRGIERQQLKWLTTAGAGVAALYALAMALTLPLARDERPAWAMVLESLVLVSLLAIPVAVGGAILRYRLYDIDVVISRSVVFALLAGFITLVYVAIVVGIGSLAGRGDEPNLALSIVATAVIAFAFQPVRRRARRFANRLVYGERATPYEVLSDFADRMGDAYDATELLPVMARTVGEGIGAAEVTVWLATGNGLVREASWPDTAGRASAAGLGELTGDRIVAVRHHGDLLGAMTVVMPAGDALTPAAGKLLADVAAQAGLVLRNVLLIEELRSSRRRLVTAQDEERRRLERNLHDGAQQSLVAVALMLRLASDQLGGVGKGPIGAELEEASGQLGQAIEELRELARGISPAILAERGLAPALAAMAERSSLPVYVDCPADDRLPAEVERTLYFVAAEALANAVDHAKPSEVDVTVGIDATVVTLDVVDDGIGGADPALGSGLRGLVERAAVLDGILEVVSPAGGGTRVHCVVPWAGAPTLDEAGRADLAATPRGAAR